MSEARTHRVELVLRKEELAEIDSLVADGQFPSRVAAVRELLMRGLLYDIDDIPPQLH